MTNYKRYIPLIVAALREINPYKIYLFGSVARGDVTEDSDIDIAVILDSERIHKTYDEKIKTRAQVRKIYNGYKLSGSNRWCIHG
jgi:predicted nucleotidyltransferase